MVGIAIEVDIAARAEGQAPWHQGTVRALRVVEVTAVARLEVTDLGVIGDVVGVCGPRGPGSRLTVGQRWRCGVVHGGEVVRRPVAREVLRVPEDVPEAAARTPDHVAALAGGPIVHLCPNAARRVL